MCKCDKHKALNGNSQAVVFVLSFYCDDSVVLKTPLGIALAKEKWCQPLTGDEMVLLDAFHVNNRLDIAKI